MDELDVRLRKAWISTVENAKSIAFYCIRRSACQYIERR